MEVNEFLKGFFSEATRPEDARKEERRLKNLRIERDNNLRMMEVCDDDSIIENLSKRQEQINEILQ